MGEGGFLEEVIYSDLMGKKSSALQGAGDLEDKRCGGHQGPRVGGGSPGQETACRPGGLRRSGQPQGAAGHERTCL